jgi:hypothetical protein
LPSARKRGRYNPVRKRVRKGRPEKLRVRRTPLPTWERYQKAPVFC